MDNELLDSLKTHLDLEESLDNGQFAIYSDYRERDDVYFIKANKEGLKLFAYQPIMRRQRFRGPGAKAGISKDYIG